MTPADNALYLTYAAGDQYKLDQACAGEPTRIDKHNYELDVTDAGTYQANTEGEIACHWKIKSPLEEDDFIEGESELTFTLETATNAQIYIF